MDSGIIFLFAAIFIIAALLFALIGLTRKGGGRLNVEKYRSRWLAIEQSLSRDNPAAFPLAILNADKLVDQALRERGTVGNTMGERMKTAKSSWSQANTVWEAHKLRNRVAHEPDITVSYDQARRALAGFKRALKDLGAI
jgi:hypothetical protein